MADHLRTIPQRMFDMRFYREGQEITPKCNSVGCAIGHCTVLDPNPDAIPRNRDGIIDYMEWSLNFADFNGSEWNWCFDTSWVLVDNTPKGAALRIEWLLNHGLPEDWYEQLEGNAPLCYLIK